MKHAYESYGFIFDLDGVIVDTAILHYRSWRRLANSLRFDFTTLQNESLKGVSRMESLDIILGWGGITKSTQEKQELAALKNSWYQDEVAGLKPEDALPGAITFLAHCRQLGIKIGLGSASKNAHAVLEKLGVIEMFDTIIDGNSISRSKPDPEVFILASENLKIPPGQCAVFEDAAVGIEAANRGKMTSIGIGSAMNLLHAELVYEGLNEADISHVIRCIDKV